MNHDLNRSEAKIKRCAAFERQDSAQKGVPRNVRGKFSEPDDLFQRGDRKAGLRGTVLQVLKAHAHPVPPN